MTAEGRRDRLAGLRSDPKTMRMGRFLNIYEFFPGKL